MSFVYLASPYSNPSPVVRDMRFREACRAAAKLMHAGNVVFSPIAHSHSVEQQFNGNIEGHDFWLRQDFAILRHADKLVVLMLEGWEKSFGVGAEIDLAKQMRMPVEFMEPLP